MSRSVPRKPLHFPQRTEITEKQRKRADGERKEKKVTKSLPNEKGGKMKRIIYFPVALH